MVRTRGITAKSRGSISGWGTKILQTGQHGQKKKKTIIRHMSKTILIDFPIPASESLPSRQEWREPTISLHLSFISSVPMLTESS